MLRVIAHPAAIPNELKSVVAKKPTSCTYSTESGRQKIKEDFKPRWGGQDEDASYVLPYLAHRTSLGQMPQERPDIVSRLFSSNKSLVGAPDVECNNRSPLSLDGILLNSGVVEPCLFFFFLV